jgi:hypothetical protein
MTITLASGERTAAKPHQCFHCYRDIVPGQVYRFQTNKYDYVYTLSFHEDCDDLANKCRRLSGNDYDEEGSPPLRDEWCESGEYAAECERWRGHYPHVIARMELTDQLRDHTHD